MENQTEKQLNTDVSQEFVSDFDALLEKEFKPKTSKARPLVL